MPCTRIAHRLIAIPRSQLGAPSTRMQEGAEVWAMRAAPARATMPPTTMLGRPWMDIRWGGVLRVDATALVRQTQEGEEVELDTTGPVTGARHYGLTRNYNIHHSILHRLHFNRQHHYYLSNSHGMDI